MKKGSWLAGLGALAFGILPIVAFWVANPPGGNYSVKDIVDYTTKGHRPVVFVSLYLVLISALGLLLALSRLRESIGDGRRGRIFWGFAVGGVTAWIAGYALACGVPAAMAFGGSDKFTLTHGVVFTFVEAGFAVMFGAGGTLLGLALVTFAAAPVTVPSWVRWSGLVAGLGGIAGLAWFPFFLVYIWFIVLGLWLVVADRSEAVAAVPQGA